MQYRQAAFFAQVKYEKTMKLLELITSKNGYFITTEWWEDNCDFSQLERFILECINKDDSGEVKKRRNGELDLHRISLVLGRYWQYMTPDYI